MTNTNKDNRRVMVAMSGGVDSSVACHLLQSEGFDVEGVTMFLLAANDSDIADAKAVADKMGMPHHVLDASEEFRRYVTDYFVSEYESGRTPNPCIACNKHLKFGLLHDFAQAHDCDLLATGHYAVIEKDKKSGRYLLKKAADASKDQSYFLYVLTQEQLAHTLFPLGGLTKTESRVLAEEQGLVTAHKSDSQDICFVPDGDYVAFMKKYTGHDYPEGDFKDLEGHVLGRHNGAVRYTLGQRKGLGLAMGEPVYVCAKNMKDNTVTVGPEEALFSRVAYVESINWTSGLDPFDDAASDCTVRLMACTRYHQKTEPAVVSKTDEGYRFEFEIPRRAMTPGQSLVIYDGDVVLGGGVIVRTG